jgi:hypothetical protein
VEAVVVDIINLLEEVIRLVVVKEVVQVLQVNQA